VERTTIRTSTQVKVDANFDVLSHKIINLLPATSAGQAIEYAQLNTAIEVALGGLIGKENTGVAAGLIEALNLGNVITHDIEEFETALGFTPENLANKQDNLTFDGTGVKFPTVDAVNAGLSSLLIPTLQQVLDTNSYAEFDGGYVNLLNGDPFNKYFEFQVEDGVASPNKKSSYFYADPNLVEIQNAYGGTWVDMSIYNGILKLSQSVTGGCTTDITFTPPTSRSIIKFPAPPIAGTYTLALTSNIPVVTGLVPYYGATGAVNLGAYDLTVQGIQIGLGGGAIQGNIRIGSGNLGANTTGQQNTAIGYSVLVSNTTGRENSVLGGMSMVYNTSGRYNTALGNYAGTYLSDGATSRTTGNHGLYLGYNSMASANELINEIVIGANAVGNGSNTVTLGSDSITDTYLKGTVHFEVAPGLPVLTSDIIVNLSGGKTFGKYVSGTVIPATGKTVEEVIRLAALESINPTASVSASGTIPYNSTTGTITISMSSTCNNPTPATITNYVLSYRRGTGSWVQIYSGVAKSSHTHVVDSLLTGDNITSFNYQLIATDSIGAIVTVGTPPSNTVTPALYSEPTTTVATTRLTRELGDISTLFSGTISQLSQNGVSISTRTLQYSLNNSAWVTISTGTLTNTISYTHNDSSLINATVIYYRLVIECVTPSGTQITYLGVNPISFLYKSVFGYDSSATPSLTTILSMGNSSLGNTKSKTVVATAPSGNYTYYAYRAAAGDLTGIIMDGVTPVLGSFTKQSDIAGVNSFGATVTYRVYKSNAPAAFTNNSLVIS